MDKLTPATRPVPKADGLNQGDANTVLTTPIETFGKYTSGYNEGKDAVHQGNVMGSNVTH